MTQPLVVGIDPSLTALGLAVGRTTEDMRIEELSSKGKTSDDVRARLTRYEALAAEIFTRIDSIEARPSIVLLEGYSYASSGSTVILGEFGGVLRLLLVRSGLRVVDVPPSTLKRWATGKGNAGKAAVVSALTKRYGRTFETDNEADAFGLAVIALQLTGASEPANAAQREAIAQLAAKEPTR